MTPNHEPTLKPGSPCSAMVGTSGMIGERSSVPMPSARSLPALICGDPAIRPEQYIWVWPPIVSTIAGAPPL